MKCKVWMRDVLTFHTLQLQNGRFPTGFLTNRPPNGRFVRGLPSIFITCHKMPCPRRNLHLVTTSRSAHIAICKKHTTPHVQSAAPARQNDIGGLQCHEKCNASSDNVAKVLRLPHKTTFDTSANMLKCHKVPRLPCEMKLCDAGKLQKRPLLQNLRQARP